ncbi:LAQU0S23e00386g1_1 [Lachancea quebecensis]|uniref:LAQU0S23e00386g1_1 n=1 Tax=Lachancea quebecensis TaxID=1654605 RepID=A0A0P1KY69_9SACH|nr:LAQU0S23e00386g1_1 [Lachancea quebecensis]
MVSLKNVFVGASCIAGLVSAKYSNTTSSTVPSVPKTTPTAFFSNVHLVDSYTGTNSSNDKDHWFIVKAEVYISANYENELYLTVPDELQNFPQKSFDLLQGSSVVGTVERNSSNVLAIKPKVSGDDRTASFNFLARLSDSAKNSITSPRIVEYYFNVSSGPSIVETISFVATNLSASQTNARVEDDNSVTYTLDIPLSEYPGSLNLAASFISGDYTFDTSKTHVEAVLDVDNFNQPTKAINLTAFTDNSDESIINLSMGSQLSGGKYIRIVYATKPVSGSTIIDTVSILNYPTLSNYKRDVSIVFEDHVPVGSAANIQDYGEQISVVSTSSLSKTPSATTARNSTSARSTSLFSVTLSQSTNTRRENVSLSTFDASYTTTNGTHLSTSISVPVNVSKSIVSTSIVTSGSAHVNNTSAYVSETTNATATSTPHRVSTITSDDYSSIANRTTAIPTAVTYNSSLTVTSAVANATSTSLKNSSQASQNETLKYTYTVITQTSNGEFLIYTSFYPVATLSTSTTARASSISESIYVINATESFTRNYNTTGLSTNAFATKLLSTATKGSEVYEYTSLIPVSTLSHTSSGSAARTEGKSSPRLSGLSTRTEKSPSASTGSIYPRPNDASKKSSGDSLTSTKNVFSKSSSAPSANTKDVSYKPSDGSTDIIRVSTGYRTERYLTNSVFTATSNGRVMEYTSWYPVTTVSPKKVTIKDGSAWISTLSEEGKLASSTATYTIGGQVSVVTTLVSANTESTKTVSAGPDALSAKKSPIKGSTTKSSSTTITSCDSGICKTFTTIGDSAKSTQLLSTHVGVSTDIAQSALDPDVTSYNSLLGSSTLKSSSTNTGKSAVLLSSTNIKFSAIAVTSSSGPLVSTYENLIGSSVVATSSAVTAESIKTSGMFAPAMETSVSANRGDLPGQSFASTTRVFADYSKSSDTEALSTSEVFIGQSTLSLKTTANSFQTQTASGYISSSADISTYDGAAARAEGRLVGMVIGLLAIIL